MQEAIQRLAQDIGRVEEYIRNLQQAANTLLSELEDVRLSREALERLKNYDDDEILFNLARRGHIYIPGKINSENKKVIAHIGGEYLMEMDIDQALKILIDKEGDIKNALNKVNQDMQEAVKLHQSLQQKLAQMIQSTQKG